MKPSGITLWWQWASEQSIFNIITLVLVFTITQLKTGKNNQDCKFWIYHRWRVWSFIGIVVLEHSLFSIFPLNMHGSVDGLINLKFSCQLFFLFSYPVDCVRNVYFITKAVGHHLVNALCCLVGVIHTMDFNGLICWKFPSCIFLFYSKYTLKTRAFLTRNYFYQSMPSIALFPLTQCHTSHPLSAALYCNFFRAPTLLPNKRSEEQTKAAYRMLRDCFQYVSLPIKPW